MPLFTDGLICDQEDLREYESALLAVASGEGIDIDAKLQVAQRELAFEIVTFLMRNGPEYLDQDHWLGKVVVTGSLRHWHAIHSLAVIYRDAYFHHLNDRFKEKWAQYSRLTKTSKELYFDGGVAVVSKPIARADPPTCSGVPGSGLPARNYFVSTAWHKGDAMGSISGPIVMELKDGEWLRVAQNAAPVGITGWSVYVGESAESLWRQNGALIPAGDSWQQLTGLTQGERPGSGQRPESYVRARRILSRG